MIELIIEILTATDDHPLYSLYYLSILLSFTSLLYACFSLTAEYKSWSDTFADIFMATLLVGLFGVGIHSAGIEGLVAVGVGFGFALSVSVFLFATLCLVGVFFDLLGFLAQSG